MKNPFFRPQAKAHEVTLDTFRGTPKTAAAAWWVFNGMSGIRDIVCDDCVNRALDGPDTTDDGFGMEDIPVERNEVTSGMRCAICQDLIAESFLRSGSRKTAAFWDEPHGEDEVEDYGCLGCGRYLSEDTCPSCGPDDVVSSELLFASDDRENFGADLGGFAYEGSRKTASTAPGYYLTGKSGNPISGPYSTPSEALAAMDTTFASAVEYKSGVEDPQWDAYKPEEFPYGLNTVNGSRKVAYGGDSQFDPNATVCNSCGQTIYPGDAHVDYNKPGAICGACDSFYQANVDSHNFQWHKGDSVDTGKSCCECAQWAFMVGDQPESPCDGVLYDSFRVRIPDGRGDHTCEAAY